MLSSTVSTESGPVIGIPSPLFTSVTVYKGIPYADTTAGANRWKPPLPAPRWSTPRLADKFGPVCPQISPPGPGKGPEQSEDCLSLNIWTPANTSSANLPVYVWIYGGRFIFGAGSDPTFDGVFGFLAHPELSSESEHGSSGNYGILDQLAALRWVKANIGNFGGDPNLITIGGQSAGSASCTLHLYSPLSRGLFQRVIVESGLRHPKDPLISSLAPSYRTKVRALSQGEQYVIEKGATSISELRIMPAEHLLVGNNRNDTIWGNPPFFRPCLDGYVFPRTYAETLASGFQSDVPVLSGHNRDEGGVYTDERFNFADFQECTAQKYGPFLDRFNELYPCNGEAKDALTVWNDASRDNSRMTLKLWSEEWAKHCSSPTFIYHFTHSPPPRQGVPSPGSNQPKTPGYTYSKGPMIGSFHSAEIWYAFNNFYATKDRLWTQEDKDLGEKMSAYWTNFIKTGDVNGPATPAEWTRAGDDRIMTIGDEIGMFPLAEGNAAAKIAFWREYLDSQKEW